MGMSYIMRFPSCSRLILVPELQPSLGLYEAFRLYRSMKSLPEILFYVESLSPQWAFVAQVRSPVPYTEPMDVAVSLTGLGPMGVSFWDVPIIKIIVFGAILESLYLGKLPYGSCQQDFLSIRYGTPGKLVAVKMAFQTRAHYDKST